MWLNWLFGLRRLKVRKMRGGATVPTRAYDGDAGLDLYACLSHDVESVKLYPKSYYKFPTGIATEIPRGYVGLVWDRSSLGSKGLKVGGGVVDCHYRGEIFVTLINADSETYEVKHGDKIAQLLIQKVELPKPIEVDKLTITKRNINGFGSSGR